MKNIYKNIAMLLLLFIPTIFLAQNQSSILAQIEIDKSATAIHVYAYAVNNSDSKVARLSYNLLSNKETIGKNTSRNKQQGFFSLLPNEKKLLSKQTLNLGKLDAISTELTIKNGSFELSSDTYKFGKIEKTIHTNKSGKVSVMKQPETVVENTISKRGRDFSVFFNQLNKQNNRNYPSSITISENSHIDSQNTEIRIISNNKLVYKFRTLAKNDYLYAAAQETIKRLKMFNLDADGVSFVE